MLFVLLSKRFLHMTVLDGFAFVAIHANLLDRYIMGIDPAMLFFRQSAHCSIKLFRGDTLFIILIRCSHPEKYVPTDFIPQSKE